MTRRVDVYGHRATDGFAFASYPESEQPFEAMGFAVDTNYQSPQEWVETQMFSVFGEDVFGPTPTDVDCAERQRALDSPIPLEEERDSETLYKVGELVVTDKDEIISFDPLEPDAFEEVEDDQ
jgi:hypothetical protein